MYDRWIYVRFLFIGIVTRMCVVCVGDVGVLGGCQHQNSSSVTPNLVFEIGSLSESRDCRFT